MTYVEQGEFDNGIILSHKALAVIDNIIPEEFQTRASYNNIGFIFKC
jgi:hypothetical protein